MVILTIAVPLIATMASAKRRAINRPIAASLSGSALVWSGAAQTTVAKATNEPNGILMAGLTGMVCGMEPQCDAERKQRILGRIRHIMHKKENSCRWSLIPNQPDAKDAKVSRFPDFSLFLPCLTQSTQWSPRKQSVFATKGHIDHKKLVL
jgi:hypothetical protein